MRDTLKEQKIPLAQVRNFSSLASTKMGVLFFWPIYQRSKYTVIFLPLLRCLLLWRQNLDHPLCDRWNILWKHLPFDRASISLRFKLIKYMWWFISWRLSSETLDINNRSCHRSCSVRKGALKNFVNLQENTCARASFLMKLQTHYFFHIFWLFIC